MKSRIPLKTHLLAFARDAWRLWSCWMLRCGRSHKVETAFVGVLLGILLVWLTALLCIAWSKAFISWYNCDNCCQLLIFLEVLVHNALWVEPMSPAEQYLHFRLHGFCSRLVQSSWIVVLRLSQYSDISRENSF